MPRIVAKIVLCLAVALMALSFSPAFSQEFPPGCGPSAKAYAEFLKQDFDEEPLWQGKDEADQDVRIVMFANPQTGTWTVIATKSGQYCISKTGIGFKPAEKNLGPSL